MGAMDLPHLNQNDVPLYRAQHLPPAGTSSRAHGSNDRPHYLPTPHRTFRTPSPAASHAISDPVVHRIITGTGLRLQLTELLDAAVHTRRGIECSSANGVCVEIKRRDPGIVLEHRPFRVEAPERDLGQKYGQDADQTVQGTTHLLQRSDKWSVELSTLIVLTVKYTVLAATSGHPDIKSTIVALVKAPLGGTPLGSGGSPTNH